MAVHPVIQTNSHPFLLGPCKWCSVQGWSQRCFLAGWQAEPQNKFQSTPSLLWSQLYSDFHPATVQLAGFVLVLLSPDHFSGSLNPWSHSRSSHLKTRAGREQDISPPLFSGGTDCCGIDKAAQVESKSNCSCKRGFGKMPRDQGKTPSFKKKVKWRAARSECSQQVFLQERICNKILIFFTQSDHQKQVSRTDGY